MLIRLCDHFRNNPKRIDKLIAVKGLPKTWTVDGTERPFIFRETPEGLELVKPWQPDVSANIPQDIRHLCEPTYVNFRYSPITKGEKEVIDRRQILGLKLDYNSEPGREVWDWLERYMEETMPRNERLPVPVICAKDEHSMFETYRPRRTATGSLEFVPSPVPEVDLTKYQSDFSPAVPPPATSMVTPVQDAPPESPPMKEPQVIEFKCEDCDYTHRSKQGIRMHKMKRHPKKETVPA
jgi:hypothetical protein